MKLSDAILLGSTILKPERGVTVNGGSGCAMGMALCAVGVLAPHHMVVTSLAAVMTWPWIDHPAKANHPCGCTRYEKETYRGAITHLFDTCGWPADRIAQWVATVEPPVEAETAGQGPLIQTDMAIEAETQMEEVEHD